MKNCNTAALERRLQTLKSNIGNRYQGWFYAVYQDGTRKLMKPLDALQLCSTDDPELVCFESERGKESGIMIEIVNCILHDQKEMRSK